MGLRHHRPLGVHGRGVGYAYEVGGSSAVGLVFALRLFSAALVAPFAGMLADRYRRELILLGSSLDRIVLPTRGRGLCLPRCEPPVVVYALASSRRDRDRAVPIRPGRR